MIRGLIMTPVVLLVAAVAGLYVAYGEAEPCKALAVESARRAALPTVIAEPLMRMGTGRMSRGECVRGLIASWQERLRDE